MNKNSYFKKGSGVYTCTICGKQTRETGQGEANYEMCANCMIISQQENHHSDHDHEGEVWDCEECISDLPQSARDHLDIYRKAQAGETVITINEYKPKGTHQLTSDITSPDAGILAEAGSMVRLIEEDENGCLVETLDGKHSFYVDADEIFEL